MRRKCTLVLKRKVCEESLVLVEFGEKHAKDKGYQ
jgi:hypothetical protein